MGARVAVATLFGLLGIWGAAGPAAAKLPAWHMTLVGHSSLYDRGMNAALTIYDHYVYIGNRTDGSSICVPATGMPTGNTCPHPHPGILIVDVKDPANPKIVGEVGEPFAGKIGITTRELRVWPDKRLLIVMSFRCSAVIHACKSGTDAQFPYDLTFFDLTDPLKPRFLSRYVPTSRAGKQVKPHEMFLWVDPKNPDRALLYLSTPTTSTDPALPNMIVADISRVAAGGSVVEVAEGNWNRLYPGTSRADYPFTSPAKKTCGPYDCNLFLHSMGISADGNRAYLAMEAGHFLVLSTEAIARNVAPGRVLSLNGSLVTQPVNRPVWEQTPASPRAVPLGCNKACPNSHSAVKVPGRPLALTTDEVYGTFTDPKQGCPWGWMRLIDISDQTHPAILSEFKEGEDDQVFCTTPYDDTLTEQFTSYSTHNPTVLPHLALITWHSVGLLVVDISDAAHPQRGGWFSPTPLENVATEDPALTRGPTKIAMWSYPIIKDGLIYAVDVRNGLYIMRYSGPHADEVNGIKFLEGNSNLGDAGRLESR